MAGELKGGAMPDDTIQKTLHDLSVEITNLTVDAAISLIEVELCLPEVLDSKVACDALKRTKEAIGRMRRQ